METRSPFKFISGGFVAIALSIVPLIAFLARPAPRPTDDLFYIDAAYRISDGTYMTPTESFPYHHYLRWPVVLPLAGLFRAIGPTQTAIAAHTAIHLFLIGLTTYFIARRLSASPVHAAIASLTPLVVPAELMAFLVRSESAVLMWTLLSVAILLSKRGRIAGWRFFASGACVAIAVDANHVAALSALVVPFVIGLRGTTGGTPVPHERSAPRAIVIRRLLLYGLGVAVMYDFIVNMEWVFLGDPLIQYKSIKWWHLRLSGGHEVLAGYLDPENAKRFVFGLSTGFVRGYPLWVVGLLIALVASIALRETDQGPRAGDPLDSLDRGAPRETRVPSLLIAGLTGLLCIEVTGSIFIEKDCLRYLVVPVFLMGAWMLISLAGMSSGPRRSAWRAVVGVIALAAIGIFARGNVANLLRDDDWVDYYRDPVRSIQDDLDRRGVAASDADLLFKTRGSHGLISWPWAVRCYTDFELADCQVKIHVEPPERTNRRLTYYVAPPIENTADADCATILSSRGFVELRYRQPRSAPRPRVFVRAPSAASARPIAAPH